MKFENLNAGQFTKLTKNEMKAVYGASGSTSYTGAVTDPATGKVYSQDAVVTSPSGNTFFGTFDPDTGYWYWHRNPWDHEYGPNGPEEEGWNFDPQNP